MCPEVIATFDPGADRTCQAVGAVVGGRFVNIVGRNAGGMAGISDTGDGLLRVNQTFVAGARGFGVASHDSPDGGRVNVMRPPKTVPVESAGAIAVGAEVSIAADGRVASFAAGAGINPSGRALSATTAAGQYCEVDLYASGTIF